MCLLLRRGLVSPQHVKLLSDQGHLLLDIFSSIMLRLLKILLVLSLMFEKLLRFIEQASEVLQLSREGFTFPLEGLVKHLVLTELVFELLVLALKGF